MRIRLAAGAAAVALMFAFAGCTGPATPYTEDTGGGTSATSPEATEATEDGADAASVLMTADSPLGEIVVDGEGMTVYMFDNDTQGTTTSSCTGQCLDNWPIVTADSQTPTVEGVTGEVATIQSPDGQLQVTLNGWPLYYFAGDSATGDTTGQAVNDVWWVLSPAGERMTG